MPRSCLVLLRIDRNSDVPLYKQIQGQIRDHILEGRLKPGCPLPSARTLANEWGISQITADAAYSHLLAEGFIHRRVGSGSYVAENILDISLAVSARKAEAESSTPLLSSRGKALSRHLIGAPGTLVTAPFQSGLPDLGTLPVLWRRLMGRQFSRIGRHMAGYGEPAGLEELRHAIADHITSHRGVRCTAEQIVITNGAQQGINLCARLLLDQGDKAWVEDPCYPPGVASLKGAGAKIVPIPVDSEGLAVSVGREKATEAKLAYITPSRQYPLGVSMSMARRMQILEWATENGSWIVEDDYDSEYRYHGQPLESLQGLDRSGRVIYVGTFSKVLFPSLRIGYLVLPHDLVSHFVAAKSISDRHVASLEQAALAEFLTEGHFTAHLRRMRKIYSARQNSLLEVAEKYWQQFMTVEPSFGGLFMLGKLRKGLNDVEASKRAAERGVRLRPLSPLYLEEPAQHGFLLGFAAYSEKEMAIAAKRLLEPT